jgi:hypothetical protein
MEVEMVDGPVDYVNPIDQISLSTSFDVDGSDATPMTLGRARSMDVDDAGNDHSTWDDDMLQDLVFAFEACDVDRSGGLDAEELLVVIQILGGAAATASMDLDDVTALIREERATYEREARLRPVGRATAPLSALHMQWLQVQCMPRVGSKAAETACPPRSVLTRSCGRLLRGSGGASRGKCKTYRVGPRFGANFRPLTSICSHTAWPT